ncbi:MAG TPA: hypothetical protein VMT64_12115 [Candidatus Binataceae bacterium]|nr:hypothetical protein [Candidatus Binataceae bacterium]
MLENLIAIATLVLLEGVLSVDNALAMALQVRGLEPDHRRRALLYGMWGALILRGSAILGAQWLLSVWWLEIAGALYLLYLVIAHFMRRGVTLHTREPETSRVGFWRTVAMVELTDAAFAIDSTLVAVGMSNHLWVIFSGVAMGIVAVRYAAFLFVKLLERVPEIEHLGFVLMGWVGIRLAGQGLKEMATNLSLQLPAFIVLPDWLFWTVVAMVLAVGVGFSLRGVIVKRSVAEEKFLSR